MTRRAGNDAEIPVEAIQLIDEAHRRVCVLSNGMTVIAQRHEAAPLVALRVYVRCGSAFEGEHAGSGISHLLEHVVTGDVAGQRTEREISELSEALGGLTNAYTSEDHICYHLTTRREQLEIGVGLLADWTARPALSERVFDRELGVVQRELERDRDEPETQLDELLHEVMYPRHPVRYPIIGHRDSLLQLTASDLAAYHARTHIPDNVIVVLAGELDLDLAVAAVRKAFAGFERRAMDEVSLPRLLPITAPRRMAKSMNVASASLTMAWRTVCEGHVDDVALDILSAILTQGNSARLVKSLRWDRGLVFEIGGTHECMWHTPGTFEITAQLAPHNLEEVEDAVLKEIADLDKRPITAEELGRAVRQCTTPLEKQRQTAEGLASQLGEDFLASGDVNFTDAFVARVAGTTANDLARVARRYLSADSRGTAAILPIEHKQAVSHTTTPAAVQETVLHTLTNGMRCLVRDMRTGPFVSIIVAFPGGLRIETEANNGIGNILAELMPRGTTTRSAEQIAEFFESRGAHLSSGVGAEMIAFECSIRTADVDATLEVIADVIQNPALAPEQLEKVKPSIRDAIARMDDDWHSELTRFSRRVYFQNSPYRFSPLGTDENVTEFGPTDLRAFHSSCIAANRGLISMAGTIEQTRARELCERHFGVIEGGGQMPEHPIAGESPTDGDRLFIKPTGPQREVAGLFVGFPAPLVDDRKNRAALALFESMLVGYTLSGGRLFTALRGGDRDFVYEVSGRTLLGSLPGLFAITAACDPGSVNEVYAVIRKEVADVAAGRFDVAELDRAKSMVLTGELDQLQTPGDYARRCVFDELVGLGFDDWRAFQLEVRQIAPDAIVRFGAAFMSHATVAIVTPESKVVRLNIEPTTAFHG